MYYLLAKTALCQFLGSILAKVWEFDPPGWPQMRFHLFIFAIDFKGIPPDFVLTTF